MVNATPLGAPVLPAYWLDVPLTGVGSGADLANRMDAARLHEDVRATLMRPPIVGGLPRYADGRPVAIPASVIRDDGRKANRLTGRAYWGIEAAIQRDLGRRSFVEIATDLGHTDHVQFARGDNASRPRAQRAERAIVGGRQLLCRLGAWPWAHAPDGRLPDQWRRRPDFGGPLLSWHAEALRALEEHVAHRRSMIALEPKAIRWLGG